MRHRIQSAYEFMRAALREWAGEADYERYVRRCDERQQRPLDRGRYFAQRLEEQCQTTSRCC